MEIIWQADRLVGCIFSVPEYLRKHHITMYIAQE